MSKYIASTINCPARFPFICANNNIDILRRYSDFFAISNEREKKKEISSLNLGY